jgi:hypothetical protein
MPFPRWIARVNLHVINHLLGPIARDFGAWEWSFILDERRTGATERP